MFAHAHAHMLRRRTMQRRPADFFKDYPPAEGEATAQSAAPASGGGFTNAFVFSEPAGDGDKDSMSDAYGSNGPASNGMNGAGAGGGNGGLHHHNSHHNSPLSRGNHHGQGQVNGTGPAGPSPLVGSTSTTSNSAVNGVTVLNGQTPYESDPDNEKWWWVCCLEFCFCLL